MGKSTISMAIFNSYVSSPEGMFPFLRSVTPPLLPALRIRGANAEELRPVVEAQPVLGILAVSTATAQAARAEVEEDHLRGLDDTTVLYRWEPLSWHK